MILNYNIDTVKRIEQRKELSDLSKAKLIVVAIILLGIIATFISSVLCGYIDITFLIFVSILLPIFFEKE